MYFLQLLLIVSALNLNCYSKGEGGKGHQLRIWSALLIVDQLVVSTCCACVLYMDGDRDDVMNRCHNTKAGIIRK